jgi:hypothetical protein
MICVMRMYARSEERRNGKSDTSEKKIGTAVSNDADPSKLVNAISMAELIA